MRRPIELIAMAGIILFSGCITVNVPIGGEPGTAASVWTVEPKRPARSPVSTDHIVQIKDFAAAQPAQGIQIVVHSEDGTVNRAAGDVWSSRPTEFLPDILSRDMVAMGAWGAVLRKSTMLSEDIIVEGFVREFGGRVTGEGLWEAVLDVDVTALSGNGYRLLFQENYRFHWELEEPTYRALTEAMNILVGFWSEEVISDIWSAMLPVR